MHTHTPHAALQPMQWPCICHFTCNLNSNIVRSFSAFRALFSVSVRPRIAWQYNWQLWTIYHRVPNRFFFICFCVWAHANARRQKMTFVFIKIVYAVLKNARVCCRRFARIQWLNNSRNYNGTFWRESSLVNQNCQWPGTSDEIRNDRTSDSRSEV